MVKLKIRDGRQNCGKIRNVVKFGVATRILKSKLIFRIGKNVICWGM